MGLEEIVGMIQAKSGNSSDSILVSIEEKYQELGGLVTKEGAAYLVARQLGIDVPNGNSSKIKDIQQDSRNVNIVGRIVKVSPVNGFKRQDGSNGTVANLFIADSTGQIRVTLWNDQTRMLQECKVGDVIQVMNGMVKQNNFNGLEISIGKYGGIRKLDDANTIPPVEQLASAKVWRTAIIDAKAGRTEIAGTVMQVFKGNFVYSTCPTCGVRIDGNCSEHGKIEPISSMVLSALIDDGTGGMRAVMFGDVAKRICEVNMEKFVIMGPEERHRLVKRVEGMDFIFAGRVKHNTMSDMLELLVEDFKSLNPLEESKRLLKETKVLLGE